MLPQHLVFWIREHGQNATHVDFEGLKSGADDDIWSWAAKRDAVVISKDQDFFNRLKPNVPPRLLWMRWRNTRKQALVTRFEKVWPDIVGSFAEGEWLVQLSDVPS